MFKVVIKVLIIGALFVWGLFAIAGRWDWLEGWVYLAVVIAGAILNYVILDRKNPDLLRRRAKFGKDTKGWDKLILTLFGVTSVLVMVTGALDSGRYQWSEMPLVFRFAGLLLYAGGQWLLIRAMTENPFFEKTVRIQSELDHRVIDTGPYALVRHPGYTATIMGLILGSPLLLGSWLAFIPAFITAFGMILRAYLEDRTLKAELPGYADYATRVPYRLIPHLW